MRTSSRTETCHLVTRARKTNSACLVTLASTNSLILHVGLVLLQISLHKIVVFPALSSPSTRILASLSPKSDSSLDIHNPIAFGRWYHRCQHKLRLPHSKGPPTARPKVLPKSVEICRFAFRSDQDSCVTNRKARAGWDR